MFETLKGRIPKSIDEDEYRKFAVMVALLEQEDGLHVVFEKRAGGLKRQPGEICLPGGARDGNESSEDNAIRETMEELEISREQIHMITQMDTLYTAYDNKVSVTLHASTKKGNRPSYIKAAKPDISIPLYEQFCTELSSLLGKEIGTGEFGADMKVELLNDGPVTICIDTKNKE